MEIKFPSLLALLALASAGQVNAQTPVPVTVGDIDAVIQEEIYFKALLERNLAEASLRKIGTTSTSTAKPPQVLWRRAAADGWIAKLEFSGGASAIVRAGDSLPGGYRAIRISADAVVVRHGDEEITLNPAVGRSNQPPAETGRLTPSSPPSALSPAPIPAMEGRFPQEIVQ